MAGSAMAAVKERAPNALVGPATRRMLILAALGATALLGAGAPIAIGLLVDGRAVAYFYAGGLAGVLVLPLVLVAFGLSQLGGREGARQRRAEAAPLIEAK